MLLVITYNGQQFVSSIRTLNMLQTPSFGLDWDIWSARSVTNKFACPISKISNTFDVYIPLDNHSKTHLTSFLWDNHDSLLTIPPWNNHSLLSMSLQNPTLLKPYLSSLCSLTWTNLTWIELFSPPSKDNSVTPPTIVPFFLRTRSNLTWTSLTLTWILLHLLLLDYHSYPSQLSLQFIHLEFSSFDKILGEYLWYFPTRETHFP